MGYAALVHGAPGPLRQAPFRRYLSGLTADLIGDQIWFIALAWAATEMADAAMAGVVMAVATVPRLFLLLPAGVLVDRFGVLKMAQAAQAVRIATMAAAVTATLAGNPNVVVLIVLALVFGIADAGRLPAAGSLPPALLASEDLPSGQGLVSIAGRIATVVSGPAVAAGLVIGGFGAAAALNLALFALAFIAFRGLRSHLRVAAKPLEGTTGVRAGLSYVVGHRPLLLILVVIAALNVALAGPLNIGIVLRIRQESWDPAALGLILGSFGLAAAIGAGVMAISRPVRAPVVWGLGLSALNAAAIGGLGLTPDLMSTMLVAAAAGLTVGPAGALLIGTVQATTDRAYLGRVMSVIGLATYGVAPISLAGFGLLTETVGLQAAFVVTGSVAAVVALAGMTAPSLRSMTFGKAPDRAVGRFG